MYSKSHFLAIDLLIIMMIITTSAPAHAQGDWYPGDGAQEGLLVKYRISSFDYKKGQPIDVTVWLESKDEKDNWKTFTIVEDGGKVVTEDLTLASLTMEPIGSISEQLDECEELNIPVYQCSEERILEKISSSMNRNPNPPQPNPLLNSDMLVIIGILGAIFGGLSISFIMKIRGKTFQKIR